MARNLLTCINALVLFMWTFCNASSSDREKSKNITQFFRRSVEEIDDNTALRSTLTTDFVQDRLVSFMVKNARHIFGSADEIAISDPDPYNLSPLIMFTVSSTVDNFGSHTKISNDGILEINILLNTSDEPIQDNATTGLSVSTDSMLLNINPSSQEVEDVPQMDTLPRKSCIFCDNVVSNNCIEPKNKLIPSTDCDRVDDMCYSMHTPFGVVERGCYNVNHYLTTYVCSCNLCNHIPIADLPYMFSHKRDWIDNVIELNRAKALRKSILREMACLRCEVNVTASLKDARAGAYCFEGKIGDLPTQECDDSEICGIKAIKSEGYIWRGCLKSPLYNYWWTFCDTDFCNHDKLVSIYDTQ